jgi:glutamyl-tRNA synthetase
MSLQFSKGDIMVSMPKLPHLQDKHLERLVREKKPTETSHYNSHFLDPFKTAIEKVELARKTGDVTAPGDIHVASLGEKLSAVRILEAPFHNDLLRALLGAKFPMDDPASRFGVAVSSIKYHIWAIPETMLGTSLHEVQLDPALSSVGLVGLPHAIAGIIEVLRRTEYESAWTREVLEKVLRELTSKSIVGSTTSIGEPKSVYKILRWALVASEQGLPLAATMDILGREETLRRLDAALRVAGANNATAAEE